MISLLFQTPTSSHSLISLLWLFLTFHISHEIDPIYLPVVNNFCFTMHLKQLSFLFYPFFVTKSSSFSTPPLNIKTTFHHPIKSRETSSPSLSHPSRRTIDESSLILTFTQGTLSFTYIYFSHFSYDRLHNVSSALLELWDSVFTDKTTSLLVCVLDACRQKNNQ